MIFSRYLPEPVLIPHPSGSAQEDSPTRFYLSSRLGDPGRGFEPLPAARRFPKHLRWDKGYPRPRGGRHLAKHLRKR